MTLKDRLKGREKQKEEQKEVGPTDHPDASPPNFTFLRTTTHFQEQIQPPSYAGDAVPVPVPVPVPGPGPGPDGQRHPSPRRLSRFRSASNASSKSVGNKGEGRLSSILHIRSHSRESNTSINVPTDLPEIGDGKAAAEDQEAQWEERATILAQQVAATRSRANTIADPKLTGAQSETDLPAVDHHETRPGMIRHVSDALSDENIQEAIRLHESGDLERSTAMFGRLADSNAMAQIMYGLALRHGWGIPQNAPLAITYLSQAASNSAAVESRALSAGMKKGGAAKGELVLAMYELANSFRHGWGVEKDPVAARSYYETAANLGDTDAMNEVARCYEEGFGGKKDRYTAAKYYRLAEEHGHKTLGNRWIWKDKYTPKETK